MIAKNEKSASLASVTKMSSRYHSSCACGANIEVGDEIYYDRLSREVSCTTCGARDHGFTTSKLSGITLAHQMMNRIEQIDLLNKPLSEILTMERRNLFALLKKDHINDIDVRHFLFNRPIRNYDGLNLVPITARYAGRCVRCFIMQATGATILYEPFKKKVHCVDCVLTSFES